VHARKVPPPIIFLMVRPLPPISAILCRLVYFLLPNLANIIQLLKFYIIING
jgi:hypothetical protein